MNRFVIFALCCLVVSCYSQTGDFIRRTRSAPGGGEKGGKTLSSRLLEACTSQGSGSPVEGNRFDGAQQQASFKENRDAVIMDTTDTAVQVPTHNTDGPGGSTTGQLRGRRPEYEDYDYKSPKTNNSGIFGVLPIETGFFESGITETMELSTIMTTTPEPPRNVCYPIVGCFSMNSPWNTFLRPITEPQSPKVIKTKLLFYSREHSQESRNITLFTNLNMTGVNFDPNKKTLILIHGFASSGDAEWMIDIKDLYLKRYDANVFLVDWGKGAQHNNYLQVAGNTRVVGRHLAIFVNYLKDKYGANVEDFHVMGHSLGAHIGGYLGKQVRGIGRLTALDPAQPGFEGFSSEVRLDESDANFVDVVHTDAKPIVPTFGFGMITAQGHVDFYVNGGFEQPGCVPPTDLPPVNSLLDLAKFPVEVIAEMVTCPHSRAHEYMREALNNTSCIFWGHKTNLFNVAKAVSNTLTQGLLKKITSISTKCTKDTCVPMGFDTHKWPLRGTFVVTTSNKPPYCIPTSDFL